MIAPSRQSRPAVPERPASSCAPSLQEDPSIRDPQLRQACSDRVKRRDDLACRGQVKEFGTFGFNRIWTRTILQQRRDRISSGVNLYREDNDACILDVLASAGAAGTVHPAIDLSASIASVAIPAVLCIEAVAQEN